MGMLDRGADLEWISQVAIPLLLPPPSPRTSAPHDPTTPLPPPSLPTTSSHLCCSQYPHEREILFAPLTGCEVASTHVDGSVLVVGVRLNVNLGALTIEQVPACLHNAPSSRNAHPADPTTTPSRDAYPVCLTTPRLDTGRSMCFSPPPPPPITSHPLYPPKVVAKMRSSHIDLIRLMSDSFKSAGAPPRTFQPLLALAAKAQNRPPSWFNIAENFSDATSNALTVQKKVFNTAGNREAWAGVADSAHVAAQRMRKVAALCARAGEQGETVELLELARKKDPLTGPQVLPLPTPLSLRVLTRLPAGAHAPARSPPPPSRRPRRPPRWPSRWASIQRTRGGCRCFYPSLSVAPGASAPPCRCSFLLARAAAAAGGEPAAVARREHAVAAHARLPRHRPRSVGHPKKRPSWRSGANACRPPWAVLAEPRPATTGCSADGCTHPERGPGLHPETDRSRRV